MYEQHRVAGRPLRNRLAIRDPALALQLDLGHKSKPIRGTCRGRDCGRNGCDSAHWTWAPVAGYSAGDVTSEREEPHESAPDAVSGNPRRRSGARRRPRGHGGGRAGREHQRDHEEEGQEAGQVAKQIDNAVGPQGPSGERGPQGQNATRLFAYIGDQQDNEFTASVRYGRGVTAVDDPAGSTYTVTFNQSVRNCVVQATVGHGDPAVTNDFAAAGAGAFVSMANAERADQVNVNFRDGIGGSFTDSGFLIAAFC